LDDDAITEDNLGFAISSMSSPGIKLNPQIISVDDLNQSITTKTDRMFLNV